MRSALLTYQDYVALPADGRRYEIHDGELSVTPAPNLQHQRLLGALYKLLDAHVAARGLGEVILSPDVILSDNTVAQPDLVYLDATKARAVSGRGIEGSPTLAIEIHRGLRAGTRGLRARGSFRRWSVGGSAAVRRARAAARLALALA